MPKVKKTPKRGPFQSIISQTLQALLAARKISVTELADAAGLPVMTVHDLVHGNKQSSATVVFKVADALEVPADALRGKELRQTA